ncbi:MAG: hypothetical protein ACTSRR_10770 [Candidatus Heimdallarchaeaceae archaeon]
MQWHLNDWLETLMTQVKAGLIVDTALPDSIINELDERLSSYSHIRQLGTVHRYRLPSGAAHFSLSIAPSNASYFGSQTEISTDVIFPQELIFCPEFLTAEITTDMPEHLILIFDDIVKALAEMENALVCRTLVETNTLHYRKASSHIEADDIKEMISMLPVDYRAHAAFFMSEFVYRFIQASENEYGSIYGSRSQTIFGYPVYILNLPPECYNTRFIAFGDWQYFHILDTYETYLQLEKKLLKITESTFLCELHTQIKERIDMEIAKPSAFIIWYE